MRLFLKLFFSFLLTILLISSVVFWIGHHLRPEMDQLMHQQLRQVQQERRQLALLVEQKGVEAAREKLLASLLQKEILLLTEENQDILARPVPEEVLRHLRRAGSGERQWSVERGLVVELQARLKGEGQTGAEKLVQNHDNAEELERRLYPPPHLPFLVRDSQQRLYKVVMMPPPPLWRRISSEYPLLPLGVVFLSALAVFVLAGHFTRPIRRLRRMAKTIARGDWGERVSFVRGRIPDELNDLERDFHFMAQQLEEMFHARQRLLRDVSHELRSPLARLRVALGLLEQAHPEADENLLRMALELERLDELIGQIIVVSRPLSAGEGRRDVLVDLPEMIRLVLADARFEVERHPGVTIREQLASNALLWANGSELRSVIDNLVRNALHHSGQQGVVEVSLQCQDQQACFAVADQGPGVPEEELQRIFYPFYRVEESRAQEGGRFGLGLAIAARVVQEHGGRILAQNRAEGGLLVTVWLPLVTDKEVEE
ncbi:ATP-binding protein [Candidatus Magnetaquicoccus inordinatus]|uniref:ATP-binding protein n=1 Tax=Candidatus Magnetaquicoccus inordinatus TaxID=2496818 RepID=UPI00102B0167|nr:ATP-binding protein [Candidatus Magnetaquicoccus inordinatus]